MPPHCRVCVDPRLEEINAELAAGRSVPQIGRHFGLPESNLYRHRASHIGTAAAITGSPATGAASTIETLQQRDKELCGILAICVARGHTGAAVAAQSQRIRIALEIANLRGEVTPQVKKVVHLSLSQADARRMAENFLEHQRLTGEIRHGE